VVEREKKKAILDFGTGSVYFLYAIFQLLVDFHVPLPSLQLKKDAESALFTTVHTYTGL
jgi:hypothetical protein